MEKMKNIFLILIYIFTYQTFAFGQFEFKNMISDFEEQGFKVQILEFSTYVYDEFDDIYFIFSNDLIYEDLNLSDEIWSVVMQGQIGKNTIIFGDVRSYFLFSKIENIDKDSPIIKNEDNYLLTDDGRYLLNTYFNDTGDSTTYLISGFDEENWRIISQSKDPKIRLNGKVLKFNESTLGRMRHLSSTVDLIRKSLFDLEISFIEDSYGSEFLNRKILEKKDLNIVPKSEGLEEFELVLNEDGTVRRINRINHYGVDSDIINLSEFASSFYSGWRFGKDTVDVGTSNRIKLKVRIKEKD